MNKTTRTKFNWTMFQGLVISGEIEKCKGNGIGDKTTYWIDHNIAGEQIQKMVDTPFEAMAEYSSGI